MKFQDIPKFPHACYMVHAELTYFVNHLEDWDRPDMGSPLILDPEWQRGHIWTEEQQISFMEYFLKGPTTGINLYFNCSSWQRKYNTPVYCVDGLQRITAAKRFMNNEIPAYGKFLEEYEDKPRQNFILNMLKVSNKKELLSIYHAFNAKGTPHDPKELERIQKMIDDTPEEETL